MLDRKASPSDIPFSLKETGVALSGRTGFKCPKDPHADPNTTASIERDPDCHRNSHSERDTSEKVIVK